LEHVVPLAEALAVIGCFLTSIHPPVRRTVVPATLLQNGGQRVSRASATQNSQPAVPHG
jgi:hypothetical protein